MVRLEELISKYFPQEIISKKSKIIVIHTESMLPFSWRMSLMGFLVNMIETDSKIYIDLRREGQIENMSYFLIALLFIFIKIFNINNYSQYIIVGYIPILFTIIGIINIIFSGTLLGIYTIRKNWITSYNTNEKLIEIKGKIPSTEIATFTYFVPENLRYNFNLIEKLDWRKGNALTDSSFVLKIKEIRQLI